MIATGTNGFRAREVAGEKGQSYEIYNYIVSIVKILQI